MRNEIKELQEIISHSNNIVFLGGAGVSTESGIPDFRSADGLYNQTYKYPPEIILSHKFFVNKTKDFFKFYRTKMLFLDSEPNKAHKKLSELEKSGKLKAVITQNIDGLHQKAGSENVLELHGSVRRNYCMECGRFLSVEAIVENEGIPFCECGGIIKPDVVLYGETLNYNVMKQAERYISDADVFIIGGTSLGVTSAARLVHYYNGNKLVLINKSKTYKAVTADLTIRESIGDVLESIVI